MPAKRTSVVLKLLNGSAQRNAARLRDDAKVTPPGRLDSLPSHIRLTSEEKAVFDWYVEHGALPTVHRPTDAALLAAVARCTVALEATHAKNIEFGMVMRSPSSGMPKISPFGHLERKLTAELRGLLAELGMTPAGRLRIAPPMDGGQRESTSWDSIDLP
jgi:Phage terminase, small subunit